MLASKIKNMTENGFEYVDLGLPSGTMWATCNVGASKPENEGLLFQIGRVDGYKYGDNNNQFKTNKQNKQDTGNEFIPKTVSGKIYNAGETLDLEDDAAHVNMGGKWRMPTEDEIKELLDNTEATTEPTIKLMGVKGIMFTSKINNNKLFIPFAGCFYDGSFNLVKLYACIWSSQVNTYNVDRSYNLLCNYEGFADVDHGYRTSAVSVRGVFKK